MTITHRKCRSMARCVAEMQCAVSGTHKDTLVKDIKWTMIGELWSCNIHWAFDAASACPVWRCLLQARGRGHVCSMLHACALCCHSEPWLSNGAMLCVGGLPCLRRRGSGMYMRLSMEHVSTSFGNTNAATTATASHGRSRSMASCVLETPPAEIHTRSVSLEMNGRESCLAC